MQIWQLFECWPCLLILTLSYQHLWKSVDLLHIILAVVMGLFYLWHYVICKCNFIFICMLSHKGKIHERRAICSLVQWNRYCGMPSITCNNVLTVAIFTTGFDKIPPTKEKVFHPVFNNNNNNWFLYCTFLLWNTTQSALQCIITPGHWIQYQSCTNSAPSQLPGEHSGQALF